MTYNLTYSINQAMSKLIERGIFTSELVIGMRRVGKDAFVALLSSDRTGTKPIVVVRQRSVSATKLPINPQEQFGYLMKQHTDLQKNHL